MSETTAEAVRFDALLGRCDSMRAEVYVLATGPAGQARGMLAGTLTGPDCRLATTLPVTAAIRPVPGTAPGHAHRPVLGKVILTEPAFWTPELPNLYWLAASLTIDGRDIGSVRRLVGLRRLGVRGRSLWLDGRRFVPRGIRVEAGAGDVAALQTAGLTAVVTDPAEAFLERCDAAGVAVIARCRTPAGESCQRQIRAWSQHPAVLVACLPADLPAEEQALVVAATRAERGTLLVAVAMDGTRPPASLPNGSDAVVMMLPAGELPDPEWRAHCPPVPCIACRIEPGVADPPSRQPCDALQAALAGWATASDGHLGHDWAGYIAD